MSLFSKFQNIEKKYALTFLGFVLAGIFGALSIYTSFFQERDPRIRFTITSVLGVYDIREDIGKLDIIFDGINIREKRKMLSLISLNVSNVGFEHITKSLYDEKAPLGFELTNGILLKTEIIEASNEYLLRNVDITTDSKQIASFSPIIIDSGESFSVKILVLHDEGKSPRIIPLGKIAGVKKIELISWSKEALKKPFWSEVISGGFLVHLARVISYILALILSSLLIVIPIAILSIYVDERKRKRHISDFKSISDISFKQEDDFIFETYANSGMNHLWRIDKIVSSKKVLENVINSYSKYKDKNCIDDDTVPDTIHNYPSNRFPLFLMVPMLLDSGFVVKDGKDIAINAHLQYTLKRFLSFLKNRGVNPNGFKRLRSRPSKRITHIDEETDLPI